MAELNIAQGHATIQNCAPKWSRGAMLLPCIPHHGHFALQDDWNLEHSQFWGSQYMVRPLLFVPTWPHSTTSFKFKYSHVLATEETVDLKTLLWLKSES